MRSEVDHADEVGPAVGDERPTTRRLHGHQVGIPLLRDGRDDLVVGGPDHDDFVALPESCVEVLAIEGQGRLVDDSRQGDLAYGFVGTGIDLENRLVLAGSGVERLAVGREGETIASPPPWTIRPTTVRWATSITVP